MRKPTVYAETTVVSYLTAWPSSDLVTAARQLLTRQWWDWAKENCEVFVSLAVLNEARRGDQEAATRRLAAVQDLDVLDIPPPALTVAKALMDSATFPAEGADDALHVAIAGVHGMTHLATWNFRHINNHATRAKIRKVMEAAGYVPPIITSPEEMLESRS